MLYTKEELKQFNIAIHTSTIWDFKAVNRWLNEQDIYAHPQEEDFKIAGDMTCMYLLNHAGSVGLSNRRACEQDGLSIVEASRFLQRPIIKRKVDEYIGETGYDY